MMGCRPHILAIANSGHSDAYTPTTELEHPQDRIPILCAAGIVGALLGTIPQTSPKRANMTPFTCHQILRYNMTPYQGLRCSKGIQDSVHYKVKQKKKLHGIGIC